MRPPKPKVPPSAREAFGGLCAVLGALAKDVEGTETAEGVEALRGFYEPILRDRYEALQRSASELRRLFHEGPEADWKRGWYVARYDRRFRSLEDELAHVAALPQLGEEGH